MAQKRSSHKILVSSFSFLQHSRDLSLPKQFFLVLFNSYDSQEILPVWEMTSQKYNRNLQATNMTHAPKIDSFHQRVIPGGTLGSLSQLWHPKVQVVPL